MTHRRAIWFGLVVAVLVIYSQAGQFDFVNYDDDLYVYENVHVRGGLTPESLRWASTAVVSNNWMPVTLVSHLLDVQIFGLRSGMHHLVNVALHALAAVLLYLVLQRATGAQWPSEFVALLFAVHPLHVGSVAWISERKDVLSAVFLFLGLYCYVRYTEQPTTRRYLAVVGVFCLGLMSKPMLVTFPFVLLLFDVWPLRRMQWPKTLWEKAPLFALSAGASVVTYLVQRATGSVGEAIPLSGRIANALISYAIYLRQMFWPVGLAVFYPYPRLIVAWHAVVAALVLLGVTAAVIMVRRTRPYLAVGWFWYLGTLVPVIGLVQVGQQSHADRYTYIPMVGLLMLLAWGAVDVVERWPQTRMAVMAAAALCCVASTALAWKETSYWQNTETLYQRALQVTWDNWVIQYNLGRYLVKMPGRRPDAIEHFEEALRIKPDLPEAHYNLGLCFIEAGLCGAAVPHFEAALRVRPAMAEASNDVGWCMVNGGRYWDAVPYLESALRVKPDYADAHLNLGRALAKIPGRTADAVAQYEAVLRVRPDDADARRGLEELRAGR